MNLLRLLLLLGLILFPSINTFATIKHVPSEYPTIQDGIDASVDGDTILVADGTYTGDGNRDIDFLGKAIMVMSENGAESCIIDCNGGIGGFYFQNGEGTESVLKGFTITGSPWMSGAIYCNTSSPTIIENRVIGNELWGIYCTDSSPIIGNNVISENNRGGIRCWVSSPIILHNIISDNIAVNGGGINCISGSPLIIDNTIAGNVVYLGGCLAGGGIFCAGSNAIIIGNTITKNYVYGWGGGIASCFDDSSTAINNTISENIAYYSGGGVTILESGYLRTSNTILWNNALILESIGKEIYIDRTSTLDISYTNVEFGQDSVSIEVGGILNWGDGMIEEDPLYVLPDKDEYRLLWDSPCIDTGHPDSLDADGTRSDMGAHYFNQLDYLTLYITPDMAEISPGGELGVTYTAINRRDQPESMWVLSNVLLSGGSELNVLGPDQYILPANYTAQVHITHQIPNLAPTGVYEYWSRVGIPPETLYDEDSFSFLIIE